MEKKKNKPGQGRKPLGKDRGGLVPLMVSVFADQAERLKCEGNQSFIVRLSLDNFFSAVDRLESTMPPSTLAEDLGVQAIDNAPNDA